ncbi:MAG: cation transporter [Clostridia bacterium]|nr:cation transporter [Clostridia bacterium]
MKKKFRLQDLDCAECGAKMENAISKIPGVNEVVISFMTQRMTIDADPENFDSIIAEAQKICSKIEPDCKILV